MKTVTLKLNELEVQALRKATLEWKKTMTDSYNYVVQNPFNKWTGEKNQDQEKQWHQTGIIKPKDLVVLTKLSAADEKEVIDEMMVELEKANQLVKDRANALARKRRAAT